MSTAKNPKQGHVWVRKTDGTHWVLHDKTAGGRSVVWTLRYRNGGECKKVSEVELLNDYLELGSADTCSFPGCGGKHHAHGLCMGHIYQLRTYGDATKLRPLHSLAYGPEAVRLEVRTGLKVREVADLKRLGGRVEAADPRETNRANIGARYLVREYAAGRAVLVEGHAETLGTPTGQAKARICLAHVGGVELEALTALGEQVPPRNGIDRTPPLRALRHLIRAYSAGLLVLNPEGEKQPS